MPFTLDKLIRAVNGAHNAIFDLEELVKAEISRIRATCLKLAAQAREYIRRGNVNTVLADSTRVK